MKNGISSDTRIKRSWERLLAGVCPEQIRLAGLAAVFCLLVLFLLWHSYEEKQAIASELQQQESRRLRWEETERRQQEKALLLKQRQYPEAMSDLEIILAQRAEIISLTAVQAQREQTGSVLEIRIAGSEKEVAEAWLHLTETFPYPLFWEEASWREGEGRLRLFLPYVKEP